MRFGLTDTTIDDINKIFSKYRQIDEVILYGSRAKGTHRKGSDIDLTLKGKNLNLHILSKISDELDDLLTPYQFDLSIFNDIDNQNLLDHIKRVGIKFYISAEN